MEFVGGTSSAVKGEHELEGRLNYLIGQDRDRWATNVPRYEEARSEQVYPGIAARWYFEQGTPRYDMVVSPGADPAQIAMQFEGALTLSVKAGALCVGTSLGDLQHRDLFAYQVVSGRRRKIDCSLKVSGNLARFAVGAYDSSRPLVIDPLVYGTFLGGSGTDYAGALALDANGRPIVAGSSESADFPTSAGAYTRTINTGGDLFVAKLNSKGTDLLWGTFVGGSSSESPQGIALNSASDVLVAGSTFSADFPTTPGTVDTVFNGYIDGFLIKLSADGTNLIASTFLGGSSNDVINDVQVDSVGRPYVVGKSYSSDFPNASPTGFFGISQGFISKLGANFGSLIFSRFWGGNADDGLYKLELDSKDRPVAIGYTSSTDFQTTPGAYDTVMNGTYDATITKFSTDGSVAIWSTLLGGSLTDYGYYIALDGQDNLVLAGNTGSPDFPVTPGAIDTGLSPDSIFGDHDTDVFITRLNATGSVLTASTFFGGEVNDFPASIKIRDGEVIVAGSTGSRDFLTTTKGFDTVEGGETFVSKLNGSLTTLIYGTLYGGLQGEDLGDMEVAPDGDAVVVGSFNISPVPTTGHGYDLDSAGSEAFVARFSLGTPELRAAPRLLVGGVDGATGTIVLPTVAPAGGVTVALSTGSNRLSVPELVTIPAGAKTKTFAIKSFSVDTPTLVVLTATRAGADESLLFHVQPGGLWSLVVTPDTISGGKKAVGTVTIKAPAPAGGRTIKLSSSLPAAKVPASAIILEGETQAAFVVNSTVVSSRMVPVITAKLGFDTKTFALTINP